MDRLCDRMPSLSPSYLRHARHDAQCCAHAEQQYRDGRQERGLALFDQEREDGWAEGAQDGTLGNLFPVIGYYREASEFLACHRSIARCVGDRRSAGNAPSNLACNSCRNYQQGVAYTGEALTILRSLGDRRAAGNPLAICGVPAQRWAVLGAPPSRPWLVTGTSANVRRRQSLAGIWGCATNRRATFAGLWRASRSMSTLLTR